jgi:hypothetical protein
VSPIIAQLGSSGWSGVQIAGGEPRSAGFPTGLCRRTRTMAAEGSEPAKLGRHRLTFGDIQPMLQANCSLEVLKERILSSGFAVESDGERLYQASRPQGREALRFWLRSEEFATRVGAIPWWDPLEVFFDACWDGDEEYVSNHAGDDPESRTRKGNVMNGTSAAHAASYGGLLGFVREFFSFRAADRDHYQRIPLHLACAGGHIELVRFWLDKGAEIDARDKSGTTPLGDAIVSARLDVVECLLRAGASVERVRDNAEHLLGNVISLDEVPAMEWLLSRGIVSVSKELIDRCLREGQGDREVLRHLLLLEESAPFVSHVDSSLLPAGFLGGYASLSKWREHELRMDLRYLMLSWRRGFVVSRLEG